jgi:hypothetical protein
MLWEHADRVQFSAFRPFRKELQFQTSQEVFFVV